MVAGGEIPARRDAMIEPGDLRLGHRIDAGDDDRLQERQVVAGVADGRIVPHFAAGPEAADAPRKAVDGIRAVNLTASTQVKQPARWVGIEVSPLGDHDVPPLDGIPGEPGIARGGRRDSVHRGRLLPHGREGMEIRRPDGRELLHGDAAEEPAHVVRPDESARYLQRRLRVGRSDQQVVGRVPGAADVLAERRPCGLRRPCEHEEAHRRREQRRRGQQRRRPPRDELTEPQPDHAPTLPPTRWIT